MKQVQSRLSIPGTVVASEFGRFAVCTINPSFGCKIPKSYEQFPYHVMKKMFLLKKYSPIIIVFFCVPSIFNSLCFVFFDMNLQNISGILAVLVDSLVRPALLSRWFCSRTCWTWSWWLFHSAGPNTLEVWLKRIYIYMCVYIWKGANVKASKIFQVTPCARFGLLSERQT